MYAKNCSVSVRIALRSLSSKEGNWSLSGRRSAQLAELKPLSREVLHKIVRLGVSQHPDHLLTEVRPQPVLASFSKQLLVGHAAPEKVGKPTGEFVFGQKAILSRLIGFDQVEELGGSEHRCQGELDGTFEAFPRS